MRVLLFELDSVAAGEGEIVDALDKLEAEFPDINRVDQCWCANTAGWETEDWVLFKPIRPLPDGE